MIKYFKSKVRKNNQVTVPKELGNIIGLSNHDRLLLRYVEDDDDAFLYAWFDLKDYETSKPIMVKGHFSCKASCTISRVGTFTVNIPCVLRVHHDFIGALFKWWVELDDDENVVDVGVDVVL